MDYEDSLQKEESRKLISKLSSMSKFELEEVFHLGITLQNDQKLISNADCLPTIRSTGNFVIEKNVELFSLLCSTSKKKCLLAALSLCSSTGEEL